MGGWGDALLSCCFRFLARLAFAIVVFSLCALVSSSSCLLSMDSVSCTTICTGLVSCRVPYYIARSRLTIHSTPHVSIFLHAVSVVIPAYILYDDIQHFHCTRRCLLCHCAPDRKSDARDGRKPRSMRCATKQVTVILKHPRHPSSRARSSSTTMITLLASKERPDTCAAKVALQDDEAAREILGM